MDNRKGNATVAAVLARLAAVAFATVALAGCIGYDGDIVRGYVVDHHALEQVKPGNSAEQVLVVLGTPSTTSTVGGSAWYYVSQSVSRSFAFSAPEVTDQRVLAVYFNVNKKVDKVANYGLENGRIIDFVTRTTPTGGAEQGFLKNLFRSMLRFS